MCNAEKAKLNTDQSLNTGVFNGTDCENYKFEQTRHLFLLMCNLRGAKTHLELQHSQDRSGGNSVRRSRLTQGCSTNGSSRKRIPECRNMEFIVYVINSEV